jgi:hypothetical protein
MEGFFCRDSVNTCDLPKPDLFSAFVLCKEKLIQITVHGGDSVSGGFFTSESI